MWLDFLKTGTEIKRDEYDQLYQDLSDALSEHDNKILEANSAYCAYLSNVPNLSNSKIPSNDFDPQREQLNEKLANYFKYEVEKRSSLFTAKNQAYERYVHYKDLAVQEEIARREKAEQELKELKEELKEGLEWLQNGKR